MPALTAFGGSALLRIGAGRSTYTRVSSAGLHDLGTVARLVTPSVLATDGHSSDREDSHGPLDQQPLASEQIDRHCEQ